jgi:glycosyltransferase involved in cell wall biosynthesis
MNTEPLVSVIIPVYNTEFYVREAIESVLAQTYRHREIICINDGSHDRSLEILHSFEDRIKIIDCPTNSGISEARNQGIRIAKGEYLAFLDADDVWHSDKLALQMQRFAQPDSLDVLCTHMQCFLSPELSEEIKRLRVCPTEPQAGYVASTTVIKTDFFKKVGFFDPRWRVGEFIDWLARAKTLDVRMNILPDVLVSRRIHGTNTGVTKRHTLTDYVKIVKESLARKRESHE